MRIFNINVSSAWRVKDTLVFPQASVWAEIYGVRVKIRVVGIGAGLEPAACALQRGCPAWRVRGALAALPQALVRT